MDDLPTCIVDRQGRRWTREFGAMYAINSFKLRALRHIDDVQLRSGDGKVRTR